MIYLATPYTGKRPADMEINYLKAIHTRYDVMKNFGMVVYSPIVENHFTAGLFGLPTDAEEWQDQNENMIDISDGILLDKTKFTTADYADSTGCQAEIQYARQKMKKVYELKNNEITLIHD